MEKRCDEFAQSLDLLQTARDYPEAVQNLLAVSPEKQIIGLKTLSETNNLNTIPWIITFLNSENRKVKVCAGLALQQLVSSYTLRRRDMNFPDKIVIKPVGKNDTDLRPLAWVILKMLRSSDDGNLQSYAAKMIGYLNLTYFDEELQLLLKSRHPAVVNNAQWALGMLTDSKRDSQEQISGDEDYKVYSDVLIQLNLGPTDKEVFVIRQMTKRGKAGDHGDENNIKDYLKKEFGTGLSEALILNFFEVNSKAKILQDKFVKELHVILISEAQEQAIFQHADGKGWERFYSEYPGAKGVVEISEVAFNTERTKALLYYGSSFGNKGGIGYYILLKKQSDEWVIQDKAICWIS